MNTSYLTSSVADISASLPRNQVPEWSSSYINYKGLKKLIKAAAESAKQGESVDLAGMLLFFSASPWALLIDNQDSSSHWIEISKTSISFTTKSSLSRLDV